MKQISESNIRDLHSLCDIYMKVKQHEEKLDKVFQAVNELPDYMTKGITLPYRSEDNVYEKISQITECIKAITGVELKILLDNK